MKKIPGINATIMAANEKTRQAEAALGNAAADAREAKNKAEEAEKIASNVQKVGATRRPAVCGPRGSIGFLILLASSQGSAKTKEDAEKAFQDTNKLDNEVDDMMDQLSAAERELARKKAEADQDMMMAGMVRPGSAVSIETRSEEPVRSTLLFLSRRRRAALRRRRTTPARPRAP